MTASEFTFTIRGKQFATTATTKAKARSNALFQYAHAVGKDVRIIQYLAYRGELNIMEVLKCPQPTLVYTHDA